jgi:hypothetical protein
LLNLKVLNSKIADNDANIKRLAGPEAYAIIKATLADPTIQSAQQLDVRLEEDAGKQGLHFVVVDLFQYCWLCSFAGEGDDARVWRRRLDTHRVSRIDAPYRRVRAIMSMY